MSLSGASRHQQQPQQLPTPVTPGAAAAADGHHAAAAADGHHAAAAADGHRAAAASPGSSFSSPSLLFESSCRFSHSHLWHLQSSLYESYGPHLFSSAAVPHFVTSNSFIAAQYAQAIHAWLLDSAAASASAAAQPLLILELGAGHGKSSFLILQHLMDLILAAAASSSVPPSSPSSADSGWSSALSQYPPFRYVCSDVSEHVVGYLLRHPSFSPFVRHRLLDFARFDLELDSLIRLQLSGDVLSASSSSSPLFVVANYVFNSVRNDAWQLRIPQAGGGEMELQEGLISLWRRRTGAGREEEDAAAVVDRDDPALIMELREEWEWRRVDDWQRYYCEPHAAVFHQLLQLMQERAAAVPSSPSVFSFLFPVAALSCLQHLLALSHGRLTVLTADKAVLSLSDVAVLKPPHIAKHASFSVMAHLLPLQLLMAAQPSSSSLPSFLSSTQYKDGGFKLSVMSTAAGRLLRAAFHELSTFTPDAFSSMQRCLKESGAAPSLPLLLSLLRLSRHDLDVFYKYRTALLSLTAAAAAPIAHRTQHDLLSDCQQLMRHYYPMTYSPLSILSSSSSSSSTAASAASLSPLFLPARDVAFELGRLCLAVCGWREALRCFECSWRDCGAHGLTAYYRSVCLWELGRQDEARRWADTATQLEGGQEVVAEWQRKLDATRQR